MKDFDGAEIRKECLHAILVVILVYKKMRSLSNWFPTVYHWEEKEKF